MANKESWGKLAMSMAEYYRQEIKALTEDKPIDFVGVAEVRCYPEGSDNDGKRKS